uniref:Uncharacterized protein n=1 Tax=Rhizophora mucronata TaxID=61149 RepID=A0A2P2NQM5_RHIMU
MGQNLEVKSTTQFRETPKQK